MSPGRPIGSTSGVRSASYASKRRASARAVGDPGAAFDRAQAREAPGLHHHRNIRLARRVADTLGFIPAGTKTGPVAWTGGELAFSFTIPLEGGMTVRTRLTAQGAALKGRWEDVKGANSEPAELAFSLRSQTRI